MSDPQGRPVAYGWIEEPDHWVQVPEVATFHFRPGSGQISAMLPPDVLRETVTDAYRTIVLPLALQVSGFEALHASGNCFEAGVVAFCALSGTGKTTTAYGLGRRGRTAWADDVVLLEPRAEGPVLTHPLPFSSNVRDETLNFFEGDSSQTPRGEGEGKPMELGAVMLLERAGPGAPAVEIRKLSPTDALALLEPHSYRFNLGDLELKRRTLQNYLSLVGQVPVFRVRFVPDLGKLDLLLDQIEAA
ncbi:MAG: hypothetical protein M3P14_04165, partial [Chloroflexota bacterium]|nr:hypothetical protein [Chloroflexota bacterium]